MKWIATLLGSLHVMGLTKRKPLESVGLSEVSDAAVCPVTQHRPASEAYAVRRLWLPLAFDRE